MIKEAILVGGIAFYVFVISTIVADIRTISPLIQVTRTSTSPSSGSSTTTMTASSLPKK